MAHERWVLIWGIDNAAFAVESGRYGAIGPRHGANLFIEVQTLCQAGGERKETMSDAVATPARDTRHRPKVKMQLRRVTNRGGVRSGAGE